ncbi:hypothetical protein IAR50_000142 [Cryptococcus sp. DSM 104548]
MANLPNIFYPIPDELSHTGNRTLDKIDFPTLALGHPAVSETRSQVAGFEVAIYGLKEAELDSKPVAVLVVAHEKESTQKTIKYFSQGILGEIGKMGEKEKLRNLIVVALDQEAQGDGAGSTTGQANFGRHAQQLQVSYLFPFLRTLELTVAQRRYRRRDPSHNDIKILIDSLPAALPGLTIDEWIATGISLGGFVTWKLLHDDPRVRVGIPINGLPYEAISRRLCSDGSPPLPSDLRKALEPFKDPTLGAQAYSGKKILTLHGKEDKIAPFSHGETNIKEIEQWAERDESKGGVLGIDVQESVGHTCTMQMVKKTAIWVWRYGLVDPEADDAVTLVGSAGEKKQKREKRGSFLKKLFR